MSHILRFFIHKKNSQACSILRIGILEKLSCCIWHLCFSNLMTRINLNSFLYSRCKRRSSKNNMHIGIFTILFLISSRASSYVFYLLMPAQRISVGTGLNQCHSVALLNPLLIHLKFDFCFTHQVRS